MRLFFISVTVLCVHLGLLYWVQANPRPDPVALLSTPVLTRQILLPATQPQPKPAAAPRHSKQVALQSRPAVPTPAAATAPAPVVISAPAAEPVTRSAPAATSSAKDSGPAQRGEPADIAIAKASGNSASGAPGGVQLPSSNADYLHNPQPGYPALSLRLREQGLVLVRVLITQSGSAQSGQVVQSSGFDRLDQAALKAALSWRYVPGKVDGQARDMWFDVPISFRLPN